MSSTWTPTTCRRCVYFVDCLSGQRHAMDCSHLHLAPVQEGRGVLLDFILHGMLSDCCSFHACMSGHLQGYCSLLLSQQVV